MPLKASRPCFQIRNSAPSKSFQAQTRSLFKIGSIQSGHHLKKRKASSHPQTQTGIRLVWTSPPCRPKSNCSRLEASSRKLKASSHPQTQTGTRLVWTSSACRPKSNCSRLEATIQGSLKKTKGLEPPPNPNRHPSGLDKSSLQTQIKLFEIGSIQAGHRLKKTKGLEPPPNPNWHLRS